MRGQAVAKGDVLARLDDENRAGLKELGAREDFLKREMARAATWSDAALPPPRRMSVPDGPPEFRG